MNADSEGLADKLVNSFRDLLDGDTRETLGDGDLNRLRTGCEESGGTVQEIPKAFAALTGRAARTGPVQRLDSVFFTVLELSVKCGGGDR